MRDTRSMQLLGRWMLQYLRIYARSVADQFSQKMLQHRAHTFDPSTIAAAPSDALPRETPAAITAAIATANLGPVLAHDELYES